MNSSDFYKQGSNRENAAGILGAFWNEVFPNNGLVETVEDFSTRTLGISEQLIRMMPSWLTGSTTGALRIDRLEIIPVDKVVPLQITGLDNLKMNSGAYMGAMSPTLRWIIPLSGQYKEVPIVIPLGCKALFYGIDYTVKDGNILLRTNPAALNIPTEIKEIDGLPTACWCFLLASAVLHNQDTKSNFDFYDLPDESRRSLLDMLTQEGSKNNILRFLESCVGIKAPTVFELQDSVGKYTTLEATWTEEGRWYGVTSGKEIISAPEGWSMETGFNTENIIRPSDPLVHGINVYDRMSDSTSFGMGTVGAYLPNLDFLHISTPMIMYGNMQLYRVFNPSGEFNNKLTASIRKAGHSETALFDSYDYRNTVERFYDSLKRKQPSVISIDEKAAIVLPKDALIAVRDSVPAGSLYVVNTNFYMQSDVELSISDETEVFSVLNIDDTAAISVSASAAVPRKSAL